MRDRHLLSNEMVSSIFLRMPVFGKVNRESAYITGAYYYAVTNPDAFSGKSDVEAMDD